MDRTKPCAKCRSMIYVSAFYICPTEGCRNHIPYLPDPPPPAEQASGEHVETLRQLREPYECMAVSHEGEKCGEEFAQFVAALDAAIAALSQRPVVPNALPDFLEWAATELEKRDQAPGSFTFGLAQSLKGRAIILRRVAPQRPTGEEE